MPQPHPPREGLWIHFIETVYGAWIPGDARGFRTRHHRRHVEGDYRNRPAPERDLRLRNRSLSRLKQPAVRLTGAVPERIGRAILWRLGKLNCFVLCLAVARQHLHVLAKMPQRESARHLMGLAKKHASFAMKPTGWTGKLWAKRGKEVVIRDRRHQLNVYRYLLRHRNEGAWVWDWMEQR